MKEPEIGDEIVIIGRQGEEDITAQEAAESAGVEDLEYLCRFNKRTPVHYTGNTDIKRGAHTSVSYTHLDVYKRQVLKR